MSLVSPSSAQVIRNEEAVFFEAPITEDSEFGTAVALDGETLLVGTRSNDRALVYRRNGSSWSLEDELVPSNSPINTFGRSVALSNDVAMVGAPSSGSVYVFERSGTSWTQTQQLDDGSSSLTNTQFGALIDLDQTATRAVISARNLQPDGAAFIFEFDGTSWSQTAQIDAPSDSAFFPGELAIDGDTVLIADQSNDEAGTNGGAGYVFVEQMGSWVQQAKLLPDLGPYPPGESPTLGRKVALLGDTAVLLQLRTALVFTRSGTQWVREAELDIANGGPLGGGLAIENETVVIGAAAEDASAIDSGAAYVFERNGTNWANVAKLLPSDAMSFDRFGTSASISEGQVALGAPLSQENGLFLAGSVYVFDTDASVTVVGDFCFGDGGDQQGCTDCPCNNNAVPGTQSGCRHSDSDMFGGRGARLLATGGSFADLCFEMNFAKPNSFAVLVSGPSVAPSPNGMNPCAAVNPGSGLAQPALLDGLRCVISGGLGPVTRHGARAIDSVGFVGQNGIGPEANWGACSATFPNSAFAVGETRHFQAIYREASGLGCGTEQNTSQGVTVTFQ